MAATRSTAVPGRLLVGVALAHGILGLAPHAARADLRHVELDPTRSRLVARTGLAGLLGFLGHEHGVLATRWFASLCVDPQQPESIRGLIRVPVASLRIDTAEALEAAGLEREADPEERQELQTKMTGPRYLDAYAHREIRFEPTSARLGDDGSGRVEGRLTLRGVTHDVSAPVSVSGLDTGRPTVEGRFEVRQSDYGMTPESVAGVVKVADPVTVSFRLGGRITRAACDLPAPEAD